MIALGPRVRSALVWSAVMCFIGAFVGLPLHARGARDPSVDVPIDAASTIRSIPSGGDVQAHRDPFAADADLADARTETIPSLPSNLSSSVIPLIPGMKPTPEMNGPRIEAVTIGPHRFALVSQGATSRIAGIGDVVGSAKIEAITIDGVRLSDRRFLPVASSTQSDTVLPWPGGRLP